MEDPGIYRKLVGKLIYLTLTRPNITYVVHHLRQYMSQPKKSHLKAILRGVKYIKMEPELGILLSSNNEF